MSLGVDLMPHKTCTLDCVYCECGQTTHLTIKRDEFVPVDLIKQEIVEFLSANPKIDYITFSGSGEPTLHTGIGDIISFLKTDYPQYKITLLTNSTLLYKPDIRAILLKADHVMASLDAVSEKTFKKINRPHHALELSQIIEGLISFRKEYSNQLWVEFFVVPGINNNETELKELKKVLDRIKPDNIRLNTLDRPGSESWVKPANNIVMSEIADCIYNAEIIEFSNHKHKAGNLKGNYRELILSTLKRRPCTSEEIAKILGIHMDKAHRYLDALIKSGNIEEKKMIRGVFYIAKT